MSHRDPGDTLRGIDLSSRAAPGDATAWYRLGIALAERGDRAGALLALRHALLQDSSRAHVHRALGRLLFDCGQVERALQCFDHAASCEGRLPPD
jgi:Flp pilus assembly protein TadD